MTLLFNVKNDQKYQKYIKDSTALQKFVTLPKIPKIVSYLVHSKYTNGAMVVVVTFDASLGGCTEVN